MQVNLLGSYLGDAGSWDIVDDDTRRYYDFVPTQLGRYCSLQACQWLEIQMLTGDAMHYNEENEDEPFLTVPLSLSNGNDD